MNQSEAQARTRRLDDCIDAVEEVIAAREAVSTTQAAEIARVARELDEVIEIVNHNAVESQALENAVEALEEAICPQVAARLERLERAICETIAFNGPTITELKARIAQLEQKQANNEAAAEAAGIWDINQGPSRPSRTAVRTNLQLRS